MVHRAQDHQVARVLRGDPAARDRPARKLSMAEGLLGDVEHGVVFAVLVGEPPLPFLGTCSPGLPDGFPSFLELNELVL